MTMKGREKFKRKLGRISGAAVVKAAERVLYVGADMIRAHAFKEISRGSVSGKGHVASKPGEYPNRDTGVLQGGIEAKLTGVLEAEVSSNAPYAGALEFGTSKMEARPYMRPSRDAKLAEIKQLFASQIDDLIRSNT